MNRWPDMEVWEVDLDGGEPRLVFRFQDIIVGGNGLVTDASPDGRQLAVVAQAGPLWPTADVYVVRPERPVRQAALARTIPMIARTLERFGRRTENGSRGITTSPEAYLRTISSMASPWPHSKPMASGDANCSPAATSS